MFVQVQIEIDKRNYSFLPYDFTGGKFTMCSHCPSSVCALFQLFTIDFEKLIIIEAVNGTLLLLLSSKRAVNSIERFFHRQIFFSVSFQSILRY